MGVTSVSQVGWAAKPMDVFVDGPELTIEVVGRLEVLPVLAAPIAEAE